MTLEKSLALMRGLTEVRTLLGVAQPVVTKHMIIIDLRGLKISQVSN